MQELVNVTSQTPLEVVLGIDKDGMTTARKLYSFLGMDNKNYSRWCKNNITENEFAE
jgi:phage anti-repressor protein